MARRLSSKNGASTEPKVRKPRAKNAATSAAPQTNVTDDTIRELCLEALARKNEHEDAVAEAKTANAEYRAVLKKAKKLGVLPEVIIIWLNDRKLEVADVSNRLAQQNRVYQLMKLPVGTQLGFDLNGKSIATAIEDDAKPPLEGSVEEADKAGYDAAFAGKGITTNPYPLETAQFDAFEKGWGRQQSERALSMGKPEGTSAH